ncbi:MAG TPA: GntG family PLP-dependent aldolase, partial [Candidatus Angelobacter sp.]
DQSDIYVYEDHSVPRWAGVIYRPVPTQSDGTLGLSDIRAELQKVSAHGFRTKLLCIENPHNLCGGVVLSLEYLREVAGFVHAEGIGLHLDGARLFNAAARLKVPPSEIAQHADSVQFCLSKGLAAPVGSILAGSSAFIDRARIQRKMVGGNMRQAGIIAAAGLVALEQMTDRLDEDQANAWLLAQGLARIPGIQIDLSTVQTNTVVFQVTDPRFGSKSFIQAARRYGLYLGDFKRGRIRAVPHYGITIRDVQDALRIIGQILKPASREEPAPDYANSMAENSLTS